MKQLTPARIWVSIFVLTCVIVLSGCTAVLFNDADSAKTEESVLHSKAESASVQDILTEATERESSKTETSCSNDNVPAVSELEKSLSGTGKTIVIDAGHQGKGNKEQEPVGPGSVETKAKVTSGTRGLTSGVAEYELTLEVAIVLRDELMSRGYTVCMTRERHDIDISNKERAEYAKACGGTIFVRLHANGSEDKKDTGAMTICQTPENPYQDQYEASRLLADCILEGYTSATGIPVERVWETDTMSGLNWCEIPSVILEMGYMTNPEEDLYMCNPESHPFMASGIADGIDRYFTAVS